MRALRRGWRGGVLSFRAKPRNLSGAPPSFLRRQGPPIPRAKRPPAPHALAGVTSAPYAALHPRGTLVIGRGSPSGPPGKATECNGIQKTPLAALMAPSASGVGGLLHPVAFPLQSRCLSSTSALLSVRIGVAFRPHRRRNRVAPDCAQPLTRSPARFLLSQERRGCFTGVMRRFPREGIRPPPPSPTAHPSELCKGLRVGQEGQAAPTYIFCISASCQRTSLGNTSSMARML